MRGFGKQGIHLGSMWETVVKIEPQLGRVGDSPLKVAVVGGPVSQYEQQTLRGRDSVGQDC